MSMTGKLTAEGDRNAEWIVKEGNDEYPLWPETTFVAEMGDHSPSH